MIFTGYWEVLVLNISVIGNKVFFSAKKLMEQWYLLGLFEISVIFLPHMVFGAMCNVYWPFVAIIITAAVKKACSHRNNCGILLHDGDLEHSLTKEKKIGLQMFFFPCLCSAIPDLDLGMLKMLIRVCFRDVLQSAVY